MAVPKLRFKDENGADYSEWRKALVGDICTVTNGKGNTQDKIDNGAYPFYVRSDKVERSNKYIFDCEAVITSGDGVGVGKIYHYINGKFNLHQRCYAMFEFKNVLPRFFYYYFSTYFYKRVKRLSAKGSVDSVRLDFITKMNMPVPQLEEQQKIADFLTTFDKRITAQLNIIADMEEIKKGFLQKIFSQEIRFKDDNGKDYPAWEKKKFKEIFSSLDYGMNCSAKVFDGNNKYIRITDIDDVTGKYLTNNIVSPDSELDDKYLVKKDDILFARTGASTGKTYLYNEDDGRLYFAGFLIRGHVNEQYNSYYIFIQTFTHYYKKWLKIMSMRSGQPGVNSKEYSEYGFMCPCLEEQNKIASFLSAYDKKIEAEKKILADLQEMKKGLLQQLFV